MGKVAFWFTAIGLIVTTGLLHGLVLMLAVGMLHHAFEWPTTTLGYWDAVAISIVVSLLLNLLRGGRD